MQKTSDEKQFQKMTQTPVPSLILRLAVPSVITMFVTSIYNMSDTFFVSKISVSASAATGIVFSLMAILQAFGFMYGHGAGSQVGLRLGAKDYDCASMFSSTGFFLSLFSGAILGALGLLFLNPLLLFLGSTETILPEARAYGIFILLGAPAITASFTLNNILRYEGRASFGMIGMVTGGILNMCLDPLFIFALNMGTSGAGLATALSQYIGLFILLLPFLRKQTASRLSLKRFTNSFHDVVTIVLCGLPNFFRQGLNSISVMILNIEAAAYGDVAIAAFSIVLRCGNLIFSAAIGIAQGFQPVSSYNYGAKNYGRVREAYRFTILVSIAVMAVLSSAMFLASDRVIGLFRDEPEIISVGGQALRYLCFGLVLLPFSSLGSMLHQSTGKTREAIVISALQSGGFFIPLLLILPRLYGQTGLELAQPVGYILSSLVALPLSIRFMGELSRLETEKNDAALGA